MFKRIKHCRNRVGAGWMAAFAVGMLQLAGCGFFPLPVDYDKLQAQLDENRAKWEAAGLRSYEYHYDGHGAWSGTDVIVRVEDGAVVSVHPYPQSPYADIFLVDDYPLTRYSTIEELFDGIQSAIDGHERPWEVFQAEFDPTLGYPTRISRDIYGAFDAWSIETASDLAGL